MKRCNGWLGRIFCLAVFCSAAPVWADEPSKPVTQTRAEDDWYAKGKEFEKAKQWPEARDAFEKAMKASPSPKVALHLGLVHVELGNFVEGARYYQFFLQKTEGLTKDDREEIRPALERAKKHVATISLKLDQPGIMVRIDKVAVSADELTWPQYLTAGEHEFEASKEGFGTTTIKKKFFEGTEEDVTLKVEELGTNQGRGVPVGPVKPEGLTALPLKVKIAWAAAGVLGGVAIGTGIGASVTSNKMSNDLHYRDCDSDCETQFNSNRRRVAGLSWSTTLIAGAAVGALVYAIIGTVSSRNIPMKKQGLSIVPTPYGVDVRGSW